MTDVDGDDAQPSDRLRARAAESRTKLWLLLEADRRLVVAGLFLVVVAVLVAVGVSLPAAENTLRTTDSIDTLFQGFLTATITGVTLVLTLNQLVLSQELGAVGDQRERMAGALEFREDAAELIEAPVSPARPSQFLRALVQMAGRRAANLRDAVDEGHPAHAAVTDLTGSLIGNAESVTDDLDGAQFGEFDVLSAALNFNYSWKIFTAQRIRADHDALDDDAEAALDSLVDTLELFGPAREHFKTLYFQWELINLSRGILAAALPALLVTICMVAFFDRTGATAQSLGLVPVVAFTSTVAILPFLVLFAYVLRIATVTKHTLSIGPFILRETEQVEEVTWDDTQSR
ncbi:hypothetical protein [Haloplanus natans]|uniref:hypothetical protein n=1 Tax=Haloplanus natans TaxID=376171 RepID=UPI000677E80D|nr:hypothetical protein [Haloplanus natans]